MSNRERYVPGPAGGAEVRKDGERWTLVLVRELRHPPAMAWGWAAGTGVLWGRSYFLWLRLQASSGLRGYAERS
jgi:hypothetical protein